MSVTPVKKRIIPSRRVSLVGSPSLLIPVRIMGNMRAAEITSETRGAMFIYGEVGGGLLLLCQLVYYIINIIKKQQKE